MPSTPFTASSIGVATVSAMTRGLAPGYCARADQQHGRVFGAAETQAGELAGHEAAIGIVEHGAQPHRSGGGRDLVVDELEMTAPRRGVVGQHLDRDALQM